MALHKMASTTMQIRVHRGRVTSDRVEPCRGRRVNPKLIRLERPESVRRPASKRQLRVADDGFRKVESQTRESCRLPDRSLVQ